MKTLLRHTSFSLAIVIIATRSLIAQQSDAAAPKPSYLDQLEDGMASQSVAVGANVTFSIPTQDAAQTVYAWYLNDKELSDGGNISGAHTNKLTIKNAQLSDDGVYSARVGLKDPGPLMPGVLAVSAKPPPATPTGIPDKTFNVTDYNATGDGTTNDTQAIQAAINAARAAGGGIVRLAPAATHNSVYMCGPITLYGKINLRIEKGATLRLLPFSSFTGRGAGSAVISANNASDIEISGHGTIDGQGADWWAAFRANGTPRPYLIRLSSCTRALVEDVTMLNSPMFHLAFSGNGSNLTAIGLSITAPGNSPNTDAIDPSGHDILIAHDYLSIGDDNVAVKGSSVHCYNITITNCTMGTGHGLSIGGQTDAGVENMVATNCTFNGTVSGIRLKADPSQGGVTQNITYSNMTMINVDYPIVLYSYYTYSGNPGVAGGSTLTPAKVADINNTFAQGGYKAVAGAKVTKQIRTGVPVWRDITFSNITSTNSKGYNVVWGVPDAIIANVTFDNVHFSGDYGFEIYNAANVQFTGNSSVKADKSEPFLVGYPSGDTDTSHVTNSLVITSQPASQTAKPGSAVEFSVSALASPAASYQWLKDGKPISGATDAKFKISSASNTDAGSYSVTVTNSAGSATSSAAALTIGKAN